MLTPVDKDNVTLTSHTPIDENDGITPSDTTPTSAPRNINPPSPDVAKGAVSNALTDLNTQVPAPFLSQAEGEKTHVDVPQMLASSDLGGLSGNGSEEPIYATMDPSKKTQKKSLSSDSRVGDQNLKESPYKENIYEDPDSLDRDKTLVKLNDKFSNTSSTSLPPYVSTNNSEESLLPNSESDTSSNAPLESNKTNRIWPRAKYSMQQKGFIIFTASAIILSTSAALIYLQDKEKFIAFITNSPNYITIPVIALASLLAVGTIFCAIKQFRNTEECQTQGKNADEILGEVLEHQPKNKAIKSVRLEYSNGTHSNFVLNVWKSRNNFINIDEKVISRTNKIESVINNRPLFTALLTGVVAANIALPLGLLATHGVNGVQKFYQNPLTNNIGLSLLIGSGILALSIICLGVHYYRKTNCTNLIYPQKESNSQNVNEKSTKKVEDANVENANKEFIKEVKQKRTNVLGENHSKDAKCISLTLEQVVVQSHNCKDVIYRC